MGSRSFISRSLETNGQLLPDLWTFEVCHGCLPPHAHGMFEHAHGMFEHAMCMFEHAMRMGRQAAVADFESPQVW